MSGLVSGQTANGTPGGATAVSLMPWPASVAMHGGSVPIDTNFSVSLAGAGAKDERVKDAVDRLPGRLARQTGIPLLPKISGSSSAVLNVVVESRDHRGPQKVGDNERYSLEASGNRIRLSADGPLGVLRGIETFLQLVQQNANAPGASSVAPGFSVPAISIRDEPRFPWRGLSLDVSRHFIPLEGVKRTIDGLAAVKLNVFHWHLSDDQGFRIESKKFPRLQQLGSDGMYYTQAEVKEVIAFARNRGVRVVPEFDMPGHATSWLPGYPNLASNSGPFEIVRSNGILTALLDPTKESTYRFLDGFIGEMAKLFPDEYFHIGGDEVNPRDWNDSSRIRKFMRRHKLADAHALQTYFNQRLLKIVTRHKKHMEGWDEVLHPDLPKSIVVQSWRGQDSLWEAARQGYSGILSAGYYLDLLYPSSYHYSVDPMKIPPPAPGPNPKPRPDGKQPGTPADLTPDQQKLILGGEAAMWEEIATAENLDAKLWPRLAAIAERFWSPESMVDEASMYRRLAVTDRWLQWLGLTQHTNIRLMRERLAGTAPVGPLDVFASILEPVKRYARQSKVNSSTPLNGLVDALPPESDAAREFQKAVDQYLAASRGQRSSILLKQQLDRWTQNLTAVRPTLESNSLLSVDLPVADGVRVLCQIAQEALGYLDGNGIPPGDWKQRSTAATAPYVDHAVSDVLIQIAPGVRKLVDATNAGSRSTN